MQVRSEREARGWSQEHLAAASGVSLRTVQRAEAGARLSPENTLALRATLGIDPGEPPGPSGVPSHGPGTLPHLGRLRSALDKALAEAGERPVWRKADASPILMDALRRMGLTPDAGGFAEAERQVLRRRRNLGLAAEAFQPVAFAWVIGLVMVPSCLAALTRDFPANLGSAGVLLLVWLVGTVALAGLMLRHERASSRIRPTKPTDIGAAGIVVPDLWPVEAALTKDFLWFSKTAFGKVEVVRVSLKAIRDVTFTHAIDGSHAVRFHAEGLPRMDDFDMPVIDLTRLRDDEIRWLDRRFGTLRNSVVWIPQMA